MTLGIFGGSFNPPHVAHLAVAEACGEGAGLDRVLWMPVPQPPHKSGSGLAPAEDRLEMTRLAVAGNARFEVSGVEFERPGPHYTVDTLRALAEAQPDADLALVVGGDSLASFASWREPDEILRLARLVVYHRPGTDLGGVSANALARTTFVEGAGFDLSSTVLRRRIAEGQSVRYLIPDSVLTYIEAHGIYR